RLWDLESGRCRSAFALPPREMPLVSAVDLTADGRLALAAYGQWVDVWDARSGAAVRTLEGHSSIVFAARFSPDGRVVLTSSRAQTVRLWEAVTGQCLRTFLGNEADVTALAFSPDGCLAYAGSFGGVTQWLLDWELEDRAAADWDEGARPFVEAFLA